MEKKIHVTFEELCRGFPNELRTYFEYCRALRFDDKPDYYYLKNLFKDIMAREGYMNDGFFDWFDPSVAHSPKYLPSHCPDMKDILKAAPYSSEVPTDIPPPIDDDDTAAT